VRRRDVGQLFERGTRRVVVTVRDFARRFQRGRAMRAMAAAVLGRRRSIVNGRHSVAGMLVLLVLLVLRMCSVVAWLVSCVASVPRRGVLVHGEVRIACCLASPRRGTRRQAGRQISDGEQRDDMASSAGLRAAQAPQNVRSMRHRAISMLVITLGRRIAANKYRKTHAYSRVLRSRSALPTTETEERLIARLATIGDSNRPNAG
jgi:hypothetical protein